MYNKMKEKKTLIERFLIQYSYRHGHHFYMGPLKDSTPQVEKKKQMCVFVGECGS